MSKYYYIVYIVAGLIISAMLISIYMLSHQPLRLSSYGKKSESIYAQSGISDEEFLNKVRFVNSQKVTNMVINHGANVQAEDKKGRNAMSLAAMFNRHANVLAVLHELGVAIDKQDVNGYTPLMLSLMSANNNDTHQIVNKLIELGADVNAITNSGISVLMLAISVESDPEIIQALLINGVNVNYQNPQGVTALMIAAQVAHDTKVLKLLLDHKANVRLKDTIGVTAYEIALANENIDQNDGVVKRLKVKIDP